MPALKIPPINSQEFNDNTSTRLARNKETNFFILHYLPVLMQKFCHAFQEKWSRYNVYESAG